MAREKICRNCFKPYTEKDNSLFKNVCPICVDKKLDDFADIVKKAHRP